ncbi:MAG: 3-hydroxyacyl-CoA dehydrogenase family protein [Christensenellales bacterium]
MINKETFHVAVVGSGMIGASEAVLFTGNGYKVTMLSINNADAGRKRYDTHFKDLVTYGLVTEKQAAACAKLLKVTTDIEDIADADFIIESLIENTQAKVDMYARIEAHCKKYKVLSSATSAILPEELAKDLKDKSRFMIAHPWNPPHIVTCVEIVKNLETSDEAVKFAEEVFRSVGREPVVMLKSAAGFIGNRLLHALIREATYMVDQGIASAETIDKTLQTTFMPRFTSVGLLENCDYAGLNLVESIQNYLLPQLCSSTKAVDSLSKHVSAGEIGAKSGTGYYGWQDKNLDEYRARLCRPYLKLFNWTLPEDKA